MSIPPSPPHPWSSLLNSSKSGIAWLAEGNIETSVIDFAIARTAALALNFDFSDMATRPSCSSLRFSKPRSRGPEFGQSSLIKSSLELRQVTA